jgi:hypothetical protein
VIAGRTELVRCLNDISCLLLSFACEHVFAFVSFVRAYIIIALWAVE